MHALAERAVVGSIRCKARTDTRHVLLSVLSKHSWKSMSWLWLHTFPRLCVVASGGFKGVSMVCIVVASLSIKGHRHTRGYRGRGISVGQLPSTVVILHA